MKIVIDTKEAKTRFTKAMRANGRATRAAMQVAAEETAREIEEQGRADIAAAGQFGSAWTEGFVATVEDTSDGVAIKTTMSGRRWRIMQTGGTIQGRPLLWLPLSFADVPKKSGDYPGELVRIERAGKAPLLVDPDSGPKYHGQASVTIPKKFHLIEITKSVSAKIGARFTKAFKRIASG